MTATTSPMGTVIRDDEGMRLEFVRTYDEPATEVWSALTDPDRMARWFGTWTGDPATGTVQLHMVEDTSPQPATIVECTPPTRLVVEVASADGPWPLSVTLTEAGGVTTLVFVHRLAEPYDASGVGPGWHYYLDRLGAVVQDQPVPAVWDDYFPRLADSYPLPQ
jgi:uncharacterized protein YndB with AHSA1/START domain